LQRKPGLYVYLLSNFLVSSIAFFFTTKAGENKSFVPALLYWCYKEKMMKMVEKALCHWCCKEKMTKTVEKALCQYFKVKQRR